MVIMKFFYLFLMLLTPSFIFGQLPTSSTNTIQTTLGSRLVLSCYENQGESIITISHWKRELGSVVNLTVDFNNIEIEQFKRDLRSVKSKYIEWANIAQNNRVQSVEKEIPVKMVSGSSAYGNRVSRTDDVTIKPIFRVQGYKPMCIIRVCIRFYHQYQETDWLLSSSDIDNIIKEIDNVRIKQRQTEIKRKKTENLFK